DLLAGLGWPGPARSFVSDPIFLSQPADAKSLTGLGEVAHRVAQVSVVVVDRPIFHLHFKAHGCSLKRCLPCVNLRGGVAVFPPHTLNLKEVGLARKTESPYSITCYNASRAGRRSFPMEIVGKVAATIQNVLGPEAEELGRA